MKRIRVKICGVTDVPTIRAAVEAGADALGFVFADSPRRVSPEQAAELAPHVPPFVSKVAVFFHAKHREVQGVLRMFPADWVQTESMGGLDRIAQLLPVFHDGDDVVERVSRQCSRGGTMLFESSERGGRGIMPDWTRAAHLAGRQNLILAGGLTAENVGDAIRQVRPFAVDVSSGVETTPGVKHAKRIDEFLCAVRQAEQTLG